MGTFHYGLETARAVEIDDRTLAHLQIVIVTKLRRGEGFAFAWSASAAAGGGRSAFWLSPATPMRFDYSGSRSPAINRNWLELMAAAAGSVHGLQIVEEPRSGTQTDLEFALEGVTAPSPRARIRVEA